MKKSRPDQRLLRQNRQEYIVPRVQAMAVETEKREIVLKGIKKILKKLQDLQATSVLGERKKDV